MAEVKMVQVVMPQNEK